MKTILPLIQGAFLVSAILARGQGTFAYDQQSATNRDLGGAGAPITENQVMGQSFTPALSSVGFVQFEFYDFYPGNGTGATVYVNLRASSMTGPIIGSTAAVFLPDGFRYGSISNFFFSNPVPVTPGTTYYLQPVAQAGSDDQWDVVTSFLYGYTGGSAFYHGLAASNPNDDLWFREGIVTPEPSAAVLVLLAGGIFSWCRLTRSKNRSIT